MGARYKQAEQGFTIIEVVLFLALSGLLAASLLTGWTSMINTQRYKDSVKTVQSFIQQQYTLVYNVQNGRDNSLACDPNAADGPKVGDGTENPGQSECIIMGRYIQITDNTKINVFSIVGKDSEGGISNADGTIKTDKDLIVERNPRRSELGLGLTDNELSIPWQAEVKKGSTPDRMDVAIVIIRSPETGSVHTFAKEIPIDSLPTALEVINTANVANDTNLCLDAGVPLSGGRMGVVIKSRASSQSFVQTIADSNGGAC